MPKSSKKRKEKAADFTKAKLKLGKTKRAPSNAVDTSFKARSIALPTQSISLVTDEKTPITRRKHSLDDLIQHLKHYSAGTRKDAILGLRELLEAHRTLLDSALSVLINACVRIIADEDAGVRKALLGFFTWIFPRIPQEDLIPHQPILLLFAASAQTHIFPEIRLDAIRLLKIFLEHMPHAVVEGWDGDSSGHAARILEGYLGFLNAGPKIRGADESVNETSSGSMILSPASKVVVLHSLSTFLQSALSSSVHLPSSSALDQFSMRSWYLAPSFARPEAYVSFEELLQPAQQRSTDCDCRTWQAEVDLEDDKFIHHHTSIWPQPYLDNVSDDVGITEAAQVDGSNINYTFIAHLSQRLHACLVATFLDCAPIVFSPSGTPPETEMQLIMAVAQISRTLYGTLLQAPVSVVHLDTAHENLGTILGYMTPYFPFRPNGSCDVKIEQAVHDLNLIFCELTSLLVLSMHRKTQSSSAQPLKPQKTVSGSKVSQAALQVRALRVSEYVTQLLRGEVVYASQLGRPLAPAAYVALLPTIWALLSSPTASRAPTLQAIVEHAVKVSSKSALKRPTIEFVARLVLLDTERQYVGNFRVGKNPVDDEKLEGWIAHLPQALWEIGSSNLPTTEIILRFLLRAVQRRSRLVPVKSIGALRLKLVPYFSITHAVHGQLLGPYSKLPRAPLRRLALDVVATITDSFHCNDDLDVAVCRAVVGTEERSHWEHLRNSSSIII